MSNDYVLTSSMQARSIVKQGQAALIALAKNDFRTGVRRLYQGVLEKQRLSDGPAMLFPDAATGTPDASIISDALGTVHAGWQRLSLAMTGDRRLSAWDTDVAKLAHKAIYAFVHGFPYTVPELRARWAAVKDGETDALVDAAVSGIPLEYAAELLDTDFNYQ